MTVEYKKSGKKGGIHITDWNKIKAEYVTGGASYRQLAEKYGISYAVLSKRGAAEGWYRAKQQADFKRKLKNANALSKRGKTNAFYFRLVDKLMNKTEEAIDGTDKWTAANLKEMSTVLKILKDCKGVKSEADIREQEAKINKLQREAQAGMEDEDGNTGVLLLPPADAPLIDKEERSE